MGQALFALFDLSATEMDDKSATCLADKSALTVATLAVSMFAPADMVADGRPTLFVLFF